MEIDEKFVKKYIGWVKDCLHRARLSPEAFDEVESKVWEKIMVSADTYDPDKAKVTTWIWYVVRSVVSNYRRDLDRSQDALDHSVSLEELPNVIGDEDAGEARDELERLLSRAPISPRDGEVFKEYHLQETPKEELIEKYGLSMEGLNKVLYRTMKALRQLAAEG